LDEGYHAGVVDTWWTIDKALLPQFEVHAEKSSFPGTAHLDGISMLDNETQETTGFSNIKAPVVASQAKQGYY